MKLPYIAYSKEDWGNVGKQDKKNVLHEVLSYLVAIDEKDHPLQNDKRQGAIAAEKRSLEKFIQRVILWERITRTEPPQPNKDTLI
jgi:hypothetical protein